MRRLLRIALLVGSTVAASTLCPQPVRAQADAGPPAEAPPPPTAAEPSKPDPTAARLDEAKAMFRKGVALMEAASFQQAYDYFLRSRELVPSVPNTLNAAYCLEKLGRADEALALYELLLAEFADKLRPEDRSAIARSTAELRPKVGSIEVSANVSGKLVIDGRMRGTLPLGAPVRVMPGKHLLRVLQDGYGTFEQQVEVKAGATVRVDAKLSPLASSGRLRVEEPGREGAKLYVDGALVGALPWEGTLAPGNHLYWVRDGNTGTAPLSAMVVQGQTVLARTESKSLGNELEVVVEPPTASLSLDGVQLGRTGSWTGRLPVGTHRFEAREEGYLDGQLELQVDRDTSGTSRLKLEIDAEHPRWARPDQSKLYLEAWFGLGFGGGLSSSAEASCDSRGTCADVGTAGGPMAGIVAGYRFPIDLSVELGLGWLSIGQDLSRNHSSRFTQDQEYEARWQFDDQLQLQGPYASLGLDYELALGGAFAADAGAHVGVLLADARDQVSGRVETDVDSSGASVLGSGESVSSLLPFVMPTLGAWYDLGSLRLGVAVRALMFLGEAPEGPLEDAIVDNSSTCAGSQPGSVACAQGSGLMKGERVTGSALIIVPSLRVGYVF